MDGRHVKTETVRGFEINFYAMAEEENAYQHYHTHCGWSEGEAEQIAKDIDAGKFEWFTAKVTASKMGVTLGDAYLGTCCYASAEEFCTKYRDDYYKDLVNDAIEAAKKKLSSLSSGSIRFTGVQGVCKRCGENSDDLWQGKCSGCNDAEGMETHIPAEWKCDPDEGALAIYDSEGKVMAMTEEGGIKEALLMAAAPQLLNALVALLQVFREGRNYETQNPYTRLEVINALKAVKKATGQTCGWLDITLPPYNL